MQNVLFFLFPFLPATKNASIRRLSAGAQTGNFSPAAPLQIFSASPLQLAGKRSRPPSFRPSPVGRGKNGNRRQM